MEDAKSGMKRPPLTRTLWQLRRVGTAEFGWEPYVTENLFEARASFEFTSFLATMYLAAGFEQGGAFFLVDAGGEAYRGGDFENAQLYYAEALKHPAGRRSRQRASMRLAMMEEDLERARAQLAETDDCRGK